nr:hypothetical protein [Tanacetum cinerariifolium]
MYQLKSHSQTYEGYAPMAYIEYLKRISKLDLGVSGNDDSYYDPYSLGVFPYVPDSGTLKPCCLSWRYQVSLSE